MSGFGALEDDLRYTRDELFNKDPSSFTPSITSPRARTHAASDSWRKLSSEKENPWNRRALAEPRPQFDKDDDEGNTDGLPEFKSEESLSLFSRLRRESSGSGASALGFGNRVGLRSLQTTRVLNDAEDDDALPSLEPPNFLRSSSYRDTFHDVAAQDPSYLPSVISHPRDSNREDIPANEITTNVQQRHPLEIQNTPIMQTISSVRADSVISTRIDPNTTSLTTPVIKTANAQLDRTAPSTSRYRRIQRIGLGKLGPPKRSRLEEGLEGAEGEEQDMGQESPRLERRESDARVMFAEEETLAKKDAPDWDVDNGIEKPAYTTAPPRTVAASVTPLPQGHRKDQDTGPPVSRRAVVSSASSLSSASSSPVESSPNTSPENFELSASRASTHQDPPQPGSQLRVSRIDFGPQNSLDLLSRFQEPRHELVVMKKADQPIPPVSTPQSIDAREEDLPILSYRPSMTNLQSEDLDPPVQVERVALEPRRQTPPVALELRRQAPPVGVSLGQNPLKPPLERANSIPPSQPVSMPPGPQPATVQAPAPFVAPAVPPAKVGKGVIVLHNRHFTRLDTIGRGGSSKVYKVMAPNSKIYALKKVLFDKADQSAISGYVNEINLLKRMAGHERIIKLFDSEVNHDKGYLVMLMECGEIDLAHVLLKQQGKPINLNFIRLYWEQMLQAVDAIHQEKIVHSDLKPANFLLVEGSLKLIDFGIAKAIANDTTNIHRDQQIGTVNYMSPEAILDTSAGQPGGRRCMKLGRPSDIWSLGCILYQMVYGQTPFSQLTMYQKIQCIPNPQYLINFPTVAVPTPSADEPHPALDNGVPVESDLLRVMKTCLQRDSKLRLTIPELLEDPFLRPGSAPRVRSLGAWGDENAVPPVPPVTVMEDIVRQVLAYGERRRQSGVDVARMSDTEVERVAKAVLTQMQRRAPIDHERWGLL